MRAQQTTILPTVRPPVSPPHAIEPELLVPTPRPLVSQPFVMGVWGRPAIRPEQARFLRVGRAVPALIVEIEPRPNGTDLRVVFTYPTASNPRTVDHLTLSKEEAVRYALHQGMAFTLLVDPADEYRVMPYFLLDKTARSQVVVPSMPPVAARLSHPPYPRAASLLVPVDAEFGVESELFCAAPRPAIATQEATMWRRVLINALLACAFLFYYLWQRNPDFVHAAGTAFALVPCGIFLLWLYSEGRWGRSRFYLRHGYAVLATVEKATTDFRDYETEVSCSYPLANGKMGRTSVRMKADDIARMGRLDPGSTFTLLRHPTESYDVLPYASIRGVTLPGGSYPRASAPPATAGSVTQVASSQ